MEEILPDSENEIKKEPLIKKDKSLLYMSLILGGIILIMGYLTLFVDEPWKIFQKKEAVEQVETEKSELLDESADMDDEIVRKSLTKFIEAFYYDQRRGYFDPPSYFAPITQTFYNYHNLNYDKLKELYWQKKEERQNLRRNWIVSSLEFQRNDSKIIATYWTKESFFLTSLREQQSMDIKYEMIIDENGKIVSFKELEIKNLEIFKQAPDSTAIVAAEGVNGTGTGVSPALQIYDYSVVEVAPEYPGGQKEWGKFIASNMRYPAAAREKGVQGKVYVSFVVEKDGSIKDVKIKQGIGDGCDEEAIRLVKSSPAWKPGMVKGVAVNTFCVQPITFQLVQ